MKKEAKCDLAGLVGDGLLDLGAVFRRAAWETEREIASYTACVYGTRGDEPGIVRVVLQEARAYGITAHRWAEQDHSGTHKAGEITLGVEEATQGGEDHAIEEDEEPEIGDLIEQILATSYLGTGSTAEGILALCQSATGCGQGSILIQEGDDVILSTISHDPVVGSYLLEGSYVALPASYPLASHAADALLRLIRQEQEQE